MLTQNSSVEAGTSAEVIVREQPSFHAKAGSYFHAKIDPIICGTSARVTNNEITENNHQRIEPKKEELSTKNIANSEVKHSLSIFPNPTTGNLTIAQLEQIGRAHV